VAAGSRLLRSVPSAADASPVLDADFVQEHMFSTLLFASFYSPMLLPVSKQQAFSIPHFGTLLMLLRVRC
jgi:hypothetical protein